MTDPGRAAAEGRGRLRAAHADRERVIGELKSAFVQGRLDKDEFDARVGQALASRTYAELAALTADLPAVPAGTGPPPPAPARTLARAAGRSGICVLVAAALTEAAFLADNGMFLLLAFVAFMAASGFVGYGFVDAWQQRRSRAVNTPTR
jgi:hypothetical protein